MIKAGDLARILLKAPDAEVRFWIGKDTEAEFDTIYDDVTDDEFADHTFVAPDVSVINIDVEPFEYDDDVTELKGTPGYGAGYDDDEVPEYGEM